MRNLLRYGAVPYLNARPLLEGLEEEVGAVRLEVPARLVELLEAGELDVALAPVVAGFESPRLVLVEAGAVVARGPVKSVLLFSRVPLPEVRTVAIDTSSRTSAALVRVLFRHRWGSSPTFVARPPDPDLRALEQDAALLIGDPALRAVWDGPPPTDLGAEWTEWTGLPFVFATWFARHPDMAVVAEGPLRRAARAGSENLTAIATSAADALGLEVEDAVRYLRDHLSFTYGEAEARGLERFRLLWLETPAAAG